MKPIQFSRHSIIQMNERGASKDEVIKTIRTGKVVPAKRGRIGFRRNFQYDKSWGGRNYAMKQVLAIVAEKERALVVVTVYTFYF
jgi:predicted N-formylglutamate amidohydrolase